MKISGKVWKYGDDINTDYIFPGRVTYLQMTDEEMGQYALADFDEKFNKNASPGDIIVAGNNWGCGSSREQAVKTLKARGIAAIIAKSFGRIHFRNGLNEGIPVIICPAAVDAIEDGATVEVDFAAHRVITANGEFIFGEYPPYVQKMVNCGGLIPFIKQQLAEQGKLPAECSACDGLKAQRKE